MRSLRISTLKWVMGIYCTLVGALFLIAPHQYTLLRQRLLDELIVFWGGFFLLAGFGLLVSAVFPQQRRFSNLVLVFSGLLILSLNAAFPDTGRRFQPTYHTFLGVGLICAVFIKNGEENKEIKLRGDWFSLLIGAATLFIGNLLLIDSESVALELHGLVSIVFTISGAWLLAWNIYVSLTKGGPVLSSRLKEVLDWGGHILAGAILWGLLFYLDLLSLHWPGMIFFGLMGLYTAALPGTGYHFEKTAPFRLQSRLAVALVYTAGLPIIITIAVAGANMEKYQENSVLVDKRNSARAFSYLVSSYVRDHGTDLSRLSEQPGFYQLTLHQLAHGDFVTIIDDQGMIIDVPGFEDYEAFGAPSSIQTAAAVIAREDSSGSFTYIKNNDETLVGYADVPETGWKIVVEAPSAKALWGVHAGRDQAYAILLACLLAGLVFAVYLARLITRPIDKLIQATDSLAAGNMHIELPKTGVAELARLLDSVKILQANLVQRTAERDRSEAELRKANEELEQKVRERTRDLEWQLAEREKAEAALQKLAQEMEQRVEDRTAQLKESMAELSALESEQRQTNIELKLMVEQLNDARIQIENQRRRYQELFDFAPDGYLVFDQKGKIIEANQAAANLLNTPRESLYHSYMFRYIKKEYRDYLRQYLKTVATIEPDEDHHREFEVWINPKGKPAFPGAVSVLAVEKKGKSPGQRTAKPEVYVRCIIRDNSPHHLAAEITRRNAMRYQALSDLSQSIMEAWNDPQEVLNRVSRVMADLIGDSCVTRLLDKTGKYLEVVSACHRDPDLEKELRAVISRRPHLVNQGYTGIAFTRGEPVLVPVVNEKDPTDKRPRDFQVYDRKAGRSSILAVPLLLHEEKLGTITMTRGKPGNPYTIEDQSLLVALAERAALAFASARLYKDLERAYQEEQRIRRQLIISEKHAAISRMIGSVAHELNNPIQTVQNCLYLISQDISGDSNLSDVLSMATSEASRVSRLVKVLRESFQPLKPEPKTDFDLRSVLLDVKNLLNPHLQYQNVRWMYEPGSRPVIINGIPDQLKQVFINICMNAIEAMQPEGGCIWVSLRTDLEEKQVSVVLSDNGPGIPEDEISRLFEPFFTTKERGTGLGLSISYDIICNHNGNITVESEVGKGATFTVSLPLV